MSPQPSHRQSNHRRKLNGCSRSLNERLDPVPWISHFASFQQDSAVERAWHDEIQRRVADMESGKVQGLPLEETLAKARTISGQ